MIKHPKALIKWPFKALVLLGIILGAIFLCVLDWAMEDEDD